jgi:hypothetical protein
MRESALEDIVTGTRIPQNKALLFMLYGQLNAYSSVISYMAKTTHVMTGRTQPAIMHHSDIRKMIEIEKRLLENEGVRVSVEEKIKLQYHLTI